MFDQMPSQDAGDAPSVVYAGRDDLQVQSAWTAHPPNLLRLKVASRKSVLELPLSELAHLIRTTTKASKEKLPWLKLARFGEKKTPEGSLRHNDNVLAITGIEVDYDGEAVSVEEAVQLLGKSGIQSLVYTSPRHTEDAPRWRVLCPLSREHAPNERERFVGRLNGLFGGIFAGESFTLSQAYYFGCISNNPLHRVEVIGGNPIDEHLELDAKWMGRPATKTSYTSPRWR